MRPSLSAAIAFLLSTLPAPAQSPVVDLNLWTAEHINGTGPWSIDAPRLFTSSTNTVNTDASVLYSDFGVSALNFRVTIDPEGGDDDIIGFVLGWNPGDSSSSTADYILVDWKKVTQAYQNWGTAVQGLAISHVSGAFTRGVGGAPIDLWSHTGVCTELARGNHFGSVGWSFATDYEFQVLYLPGNPGTVDVWLNGQLEFHVSGTFNAGRFGCYNLSQSRMEFQFLLPAAFTTFGNGCRGSAGTPYLFSPEAPYIGGTLPLIGANLLPSAVPVLILGVSNNSWHGVPLPLDLAPLGAAGCSLYSSSDIFLPIANFNGTAYTSLHIPRTAVPGTTPAVFVQLLATDPAANPLGMVLSNAGALTLGIR